MTKKIGIAGAGIGGLTAALCLAKTGLTDIVIFEQTEGDAGGGAGIQLSPNAMHVMKSLNLSLEAIATEPEAGSLRHYQTGRLYYRSPMANYASLYGAPYLHVYHGDLVGLLRQTAVARGVQVRQGTKVTGYEQDADEVRLQLSDGSLQAADLLVGADGIHSTVRGTGRDAVFTGQFAWRGLVAASRLPPGLVPPEANVWLGPGQHFVAYHVRGGRWINFVAVQEDKHQTDSCQLPQPANMAEVCTAFAGWHEAVQAIIAACESCQLWALFDRKPLANWVDGRVVLLGDACHPMLPFMAQGAAMAMEDAYTLASALQNQRTLAVALACYEQRRQPRVRRLYQLSRQNRHLFHADNVRTRALRGLQFALARALPALPQRQLAMIYGFNVTQQEMKWLKNSS